ncbi:MAG: hypothetical protein ACQEV0_08455 [Bacillota bacterium]
MKHYRKINGAGRFIEDILLDSIPTDEEGEADPFYIVEPVPYGFFWPKWNGTEWAGGRGAPEPHPVKSSAVEVLRTQVRASDNRADFLERCLVEMAQLVYK